MADGSSNAAPLRSIVIVGGGTAGWMAAALLAKRLERQPVTITVVESSDIRTVGVGEATVPGIRDYFRQVGLDDLAVLKATQGTIKLGIEFVDWAGAGSGFFHPFGLYGAPTRGVSFHQYWLKLAQAGDDRPLGDYSLCTALAMANRILPPPRPGGPDLLFFDYAVHFDAGLYAQLLARVAIAAAVRHIDARIVDVALSPDDGFVAGVRTDSGALIEGDLFIDCSGFRSLLLGGALDVPFEDWTHLLPCDRAVAIPCARSGPLTPYTRSTALGAGWQWRIPLQHRVGNGYVYAGAHLSDDEAIATLRENLEGEALAEPNLIRFRTGHRARFWDRNVVGLGLAAGFLEPLESTSITLIQTGIEKLLDLFPDRRCDAALADEYNRATTLEYARIRDFLLLHYAANARRGEPLWDACRAAALPEELAHKVRMFRARGKLVRYAWESFLDPSWLSMYAGFGWLPGVHDPLADFFSEDELRDAFARMRTSIADALSDAVPHEAFIATNCAAYSSNRR